MTERRKEKLLGVLRRRQPDLTIVMEDIHDPHNASAMLRSADAVGIGEVQLVYVNERFPRLGKKSSASANKWIARRTFRSIAECYGTLRAEEMKIYATSLGKHSTSLYDLDLTANVALVFGNEHRGVSEEAAHQADAVFQIPMTGMIQSLNVSVACAVSLYEAFRQRLLAGMYATPRLSEADIGRLFRAWSRS